MRYQKARYVQYSMTEEKGDFEHFSGNASTPHFNPKVHIEKKGEEINEFCVQYNFTRVKYTASRDVFPEEKNQPSRCSTLLAKSTLQLRCNEWRPQA